MAVDAAHRFNNDLRYRDGDHEAQRQLTPPYVLEPVRAALGGWIGLDPCTEPDNPTGARYFYTVEDDGLAQPWAIAGLHGWPIFVNPPYSKAREPWVRKCIESARLGHQVVLLIPAHPDTRIWHEAMQTVDAVCFLKGRVKFGVLRANRRQEAASHPSALLGWNVTLRECEHLGTILRVDHNGSTGAQR